MAKLGSWRGMRRYMCVVGILALVVSIATMSNFYSLRSSLISDTFCNKNYPRDLSSLTSHMRNGSELKLTMYTLTQKIQQEIIVIRELSKNSSSNSSLRYGKFLADILGLVEEIQASFEGADQNESKTEFIHPLVKQKEHSDEPSDYFLIEEIRKYVRIKPNRSGKQNFMGANGTFTSIGHACFAMKKDLEEYMDYDIGDICKDDWKLAQRLMVHGCDPLPRRRCFSRAPQLYTKPFPINESMWKLASG